MLGGNGTLSIKQESFDTSPSWTVKSSGDSLKAWEISADKIDISSTLFDRIKDPPKLNILRHVHKALPA
jgi:hypothetical protein